MAGGSWAGLFTTLDGVCEDPGNWSMPYFNRSRFAVWTGVLELFVVPALIGVASGCLTGRGRYCCDSWTPKSLTTAS
jgi:hypothetical protein